MIVMEALPSQYGWLAREVGLPKMLAEGLKLLGTKELSGARNNPVILSWAKEVGLENKYTADETPWCGLFAALVACRAGKPRSKLPKNPLWALNWAKWGNDAGQPELGDVLVFTRHGGGHVGLYVGEDDPVEFAIASNLRGPLETCYHVLGGNQSNEVSIKRIEKSRLYAARNLFEIGEPPSSRPILLKPFGEISSNEQ